MAALKNWVEPLVSPWPPASLTTRAREAGAARASQSFGLLRGRDQGDLPAWQRSPRLKLSPEIKLNAGLFLV